MFSSRALHLSVVLSGVIVITSASRLGAQSNAQAGTQRGVSYQNTSVTWSQPGTVVDSDSLMAICAAPPMKPLMKKKAIPSKVSAPRFVSTPVGPRKPARKRTATAQKVAPLSAPRLLCPQIQIGPSMLGSLDHEESVIPLPGDLIPEVAEMTPVTPRELPISDITPVTPTTGGRNWGPLVWLFGGGAGVGVFTKFTDDKPKNPNPPINPPVIPPDPEGPPPVTATPEPGTLVLMGTGLAALAGAIRRRRQNGVTKE